MRSISPLPILVMTLIMPPCAATAQDTGAQTAPGAQTRSTQAIPAVPRSFHGLELGMSMVEAKKILASDGLFYYRGDVDEAFCPDRTRRSSRLLDCRM